jgi:ribosomal protein L16 Arg81 hydroxylase
MVRFAAFASPPTKGLRVHYDISSVILLQVRGRKLIRVGPSSMPYPTVGYANGLPLRGANLVQFSDRDPPVAPEDLTEYVLEPGSAIFLPGGYWHTTHCLDDSFAISIGLAVPTMVELVLQGLRSCLVRSSEWRRPAFRAWGDPESRQFAVKRLRSLLLDLGRIAAELEPEQVFASHSKVDVPRKLKHLTPATRFLKNPELSVDLTESDGKSTRAVLKQGEDSVSMIANEHQALGLKWITDRRKSFSLSDLQSHVGGEDLDLRALVVALATTGALYQLPARVEERRSPDAGR